MARSQAKSSTKNSGRQAQEERHRGIEERPQQAFHRSARLERVLQQSTSEDEGIEPKHLPSPPPSNTLSKGAPPYSPIFLEPKTVKQLCPPQKVEANQKPEHKRKRSQEAEPSHKGPLAKWPRISPTSCAFEDEETTEITNGHPIDHWLQVGNWPKEYFEPGSQTWEALEADHEADKLAEELQREEWNKKQAAKVNNMAHPLLARKRSTASLRRQNAELGIDTSSDLPREEKSAKYGSPGYEKDLEDKGGSFMRESDLSITEKSKAIYQNLLSSAQTVVQDSLFRDDRFKTTLSKIHNENEAMVLQDITRLIVPSAKNLATCGATGLKHLVESVNRGWDSAITVTTPRPQPDYSVAFGQSAFTNDQLEKLKPFVGNLTRQPADLSYFMASWRMYFPFLTCEVKCGASALDIADRQNAHSMTHAVRAVVELYRYAKWEKEFDWKKELHREILAFSISHDDTAVRIYGHYPVIENDRTTFYRHPIRSFLLYDEDGRDKWTAYKFTKNVYDVWMPNHLNRITKAIDALPVRLNFEVSSASFMSAASTENDSEVLDSQEIAASAPSSQDTVGFKKPKLPPKVMLQQENDRQKEQIDEQKDRINQLIGQVEQQKEHMDMLMQRLS